MLDLVGGGEGFIDTQVIIGRRLSVAEGQGGGSGSGRGDCLDPCDVSIGRSTLGEQSSLGFLDPDLGACHRYLISEPRASWIVGDYYPPLRLQSTSI